MNRPKKYRTKLAEIEAIQWNGINLEEIKRFVGEFYPCKPDVFEKKYELIKK